MLTGRQLSDVDYVPGTFTSGGARLVYAASSARRTAKGKAAIRAKNATKCTVGAVAEVIRRLYCNSTERKQVIKHCSLKLRKRIMRLKPPHQFDKLQILLRSGVNTDGGDLLSPWVNAVAEVVSEFAERLNLVIGTHSAASSFATVFTATICSKMTSGETIGRIPIVPKVAWIAKHSFPDVFYSLFNVNCRSMSIMWREIKLLARRHSIVCTVPSASNGLPVIRMFNPGTQNRYLPTYKYSCRK